MHWLLLLSFSRLAFSLTPALISRDNGTSDSTGVPISPDPNAQFVNCSDITTGRANKCWAELNLTNYVIQWINNTECSVGEGFAECFLRHNGFVSFDCSHITVSSCPAPQSPGLNMDPKAFYVVYNIYAINSFFYSWWLAISGIGSIASQNIASIAEIVPGANTTQYDLQSILHLLAVLGPMPANSSTSTAGQTSQTASQVIGSAAASNPDVAKFLYPSTTNSQIIQLANLEANLAQILTQVQSNLNQTLTAVEYNVTEFLAFASTGNFSAHAPSLPDNENTLLYPLMTYLVSAALTNANVTSVVARDTNVLDLATNSSSANLNYPINCTAYDQNNICDGWWYSEDYQSTFALDDFNHIGKDMNSVLSQILSAGYTSGQLLFETGYECNGNTTTPSFTLTTSGVNIACFSQLKVLTWDDACVDPSLTNSQCEFIEQPRQPGFLGKSQTKVNGKSVTQYQVPYSYLGPLINQKDLKLKRT